MNSSWRDEAFSHYHLTPTDESAWMDIFPRKILKEEEELDWEMLYRKIKYNDGNKNDGGGDNFLKEVSLHDVRLDPNSIHGYAQQTNLEYLLMLDVDSLVWSFRKTAGLSTPGYPYGGWESPKQELRGHFVGHYLSATAQMWASTHNDTLHDKMNAVVSALFACQEKLGTGYLSAFPSEFFDRVEAIKPVWAPYYTIHKIMAGLVDQYSLGGNSQALKMVVWMADYFFNRVQNVIAQYTVERHYQSQNEETGGMNDVLYKLYSITGDQKHLVLAHLFDKPCFLGMLAVKADSLADFHANTHIPLVIGAQRRYEVTGDPIYKEIGTYFMDVVNSSHSYATGGTSFNEHWDGAKRLAQTLKTENEESCTTYNMLKVSRHLFRWTKEMAYADYYERALTNGILGIQRGRDPGVMIYMLPLGRGVSKAHSYHGWGTKFDSFWCCYGTGIESFSKLGDSIYFEKDGNQLYIIQFISSSFDWKSGGLVVNQKVEPVSSSDRVLRVTLKFSANKGTDKSSTLNLRIPFWTDSTGANAKLNDEVMSLPAPGNFLSVSRKWIHGDILNLELPMTLRTEVLKDERPEFASIHAILYGPFLLAGLSTGDWDLEVGKDTPPSEWIKAVPASHNSQLISLSQQSNNATLVLTLSNDLITMEKKPESGTTSAVQATFRFMIGDMDSSHLLSETDLVGKSVMIEPFNAPGALVVHQGHDKELSIANDEGMKGSSMFQVVEGLNKKGTVSLESESEKGCFLYTGAFYDSGTKVKLSCQSESTDDEFEDATSFKLEKGLSEYHPISFVATGKKSNFVLMPLLSFVDQNYTVYFNLGA
ncbi:proline-tRNA ligase [Thalictrum thalictroides]|uniref:Proline-tRNA ligase n=1 Tax=Thalictrum thalictroides TaxID=46969 RepID=A0A7J6UT51_THATH|nr:proline-tRNA ligase [Thalictrum thalictroides]